jgi:hypothetical protein
MQLSTSTQYHVIGLHSGGYLPISCIGPVVHCIVDVSKRDSISGADGETTWY